MSNCVKKSKLSKALAAVLLAGIVGCGTGCEMAQGVMAIAKTTATGVVTDAVGGFVGGALDNLLGNAGPGTEGA